MARRQTRQGLVLGVSLLSLVGFGCTPEATAPPPPPTTSSTPGESAQEREERLAYEAAEKSYRTFRAEVERVYSIGGAKRPTALMKETAGGQYLASYQEVSQALLELSHRSRGLLRIGYVHRGGFDPAELVLDVCEDGRDVVTYDKKNRRLYNDDVRKLRLTARLTSGKWKIWTGEGEKVTSCG